MVKSQSKSSVKDQKELVDNKSTFKYMNKYSITLAILILLSSLILSLVLTFTLKYRKPKSEFLSPESRYTLLETFTATLNDIPYYIYLAEKFSPENISIKPRPLDSILDKDIPFDSGKFAEIDYTIEKILGIIEKLKNLLESLTTREQVTLNLNTLFKLKIEMDKIMFIGLEKCSKKLFLTCTTDLSECVEVFFQKIVRSLLLHKYFKMKVKFEEVFSVLIGGHEIDEDNILGIYPKLFETTSQISHEIYNFLFSMLLKKELVEITHFNLQENNFLNNTLIFAILLQHYESCYLYLIYFHVDKTSLEEDGVNLNGRLISGIPDFRLKTFQESLRNLEEMLRTVKVGGLVFGSKNDDGNEIGASLQRQGIKKVSYSLIEYFENILSLDQ